MPNTPPRYHRDYANAVSDIYQNMGRAQAEARLQQGGIWANAFGQIGQTVSAIPGQLQAQKDAEAQRQRMAKQDALSDVQRELAELNLEKARREDAEDMVLNQLISTSVDQSGKFDPDLFSKNASELGFGQFIAPTLSEHAKTEAIKLQLQAGRISAAQAERQILSNYAFNLWQNAFDPQVVQATWAKLKTDGMSDETIAQYKAMPTADFVSAVMGLLPKRKPAEEVTLNEGQVRRVPMQTVFGQDILDEQGQPRYTEIRGPEKPKTLEQQFAEAKTPEERARIEGLMRQEAAAKRAPEKTTFEWAKLPNGSVRYMTPQEIRAQGGTKVEAPRPNTEDEKKSYGFAVQMGQAISIMDELESKLTDTELYQIQTLPQEALIGWANRKNTSEAAKRYLRAFEQFTESRLRPVSGAAIADSEYARDRRTYAKQYGETPQLAADRMAARNSALQALQTRSGSMYQGGASGNSPAAQAGPQIGERRTANGETREWNGTTWVLVGGR